jgi:hypothetical protein
MLSHAPERCRPHRRPAVRSVMGFLGVRTTVALPARRGCENGRRRAKQRRREFSRLILRIRSCACPLRKSPQVRERLAIFAGHPYRRGHGVDPLWGATKMHSEVLKVSIAVAQTTVSIYMVPPWRAAMRRCSLFLSRVAAATSPMSYFKLDALFLVPVPWLVSATLDSRLTVTTPLCHGVCHENVRRQDWREISPDISCRG